MTNHALVFTAIQAYSANEFYADDLMSYLAQNSTPLPREVLLRVLDNFSLTGMLWHNGRHFYEKRRLIPWQLADQVDAVVAA